jgi:DNA ligase (NAD+)
MTAKPKKIVRPDVASLTKAQAKVEHMRLALEIERHDHAYYQEDAPVISDAEYDVLRKRFNAIETRFPELVTGDRRRRRLARRRQGNSRRSGMRCRCSRQRFAEEDVSTSSAASAASSSSTTATASTSAPSRRSTGCRCRCAMRGGELVTAATRGDGAEGEDVTANIRTLGTA